MSRRTEKLGSLIRDEIAEVILRDLNDPRLMGLPTITRVKVSPDLSQADVYISVMGTEGQQSAALRALQHSAGLMRSKFTKTLPLRQVPRLRFHIDEGLKKEIAVLDLLRKVAAESEEADRKKNQGENPDASESSTES